jgi:glycosyltransferase involved in cell wall biosynthesis
MRILNVSSLYPPNVVGGAELGLRTMSEAMAAAGHELHVVTLQPPEGRGKPVGDGRGPVTVHAVPLINIYWPFDSASGRRAAAKRALWHGIDTANAAMARQVERIVRAVQPDIVLTHNLQGFSTAVMPAIKRAAVPLVHVLHDYSLLCPQTTLWRNGRNCGLQTERCTACRLLTAPRRLHLASVDGVIGVSKAVLELHRGHGLFDNVPAKVIYNALKPSLKIRTRLPAASNDIVTLGYLGRISRSKGIETLLAAAQRLELSGVRFRLLIAGRGDPEYLLELRRRWPLASVQYLGFVDAAKFLSRLDALVFPTESLEALGNGVFEAFSQGVPVIGSRTGGIPETIDNGITGFLYGAGRSAELAERMRRLIDNRVLRRMMAEAALRKAEEYTAARRANEYLAILGQFVDAKPAGKVA